MKQLYFLCLTLFITTLSYGQISVQNFGTGTATIGGNQTGSTAFIPNPTISGTTWARAGAIAPAARINLQNTPAIFGATDTYINAVASSTASVTKFSPMVNYTASKEFYTSFKVLFGDASAGTTANSGSWSFYQGDGSDFNDGSAVTTAQTFTGLRFTYTGAGTVTLQFLNTTTWGNAGLTTTTFNQAQVYTVQIVGNNTTLTKIYNYDGIEGSVAIDKFDLYIDGVLIGNDLVKGNFPNDANVDSVTFTGISSTSNVANIFVDNIVVYNSIPANVLNIGQNEIANFSLYPNPVKGGQVFISSNNNYAERTVQIFDVLGKQVISQNGTQNSVEVGHLTKGIYIIKVAEEGKVATRKLVIE